jgi:hypothetical protein
LPGVRAFERHRAELDRIRHANQYAARLRQARSRGLYPRIQHYIAGELFLLIIDLPPAARSVVLT